MDHLVIIFYVTHFHILDIYYVLISILVFMSISLLLDILKNRYYILTKLHNKMI
jgi:hypothetical protein